jgi:hypothetical protein
MSIATWQGNKLVIMSNRMSKDSQGRSMVTSSLTRTLSMSADGTLTIQASGTPPPLPKTSKVMSVYRPGAER